MEGEDREGGKDGEKIEREVRLEGEDREGGKDGGRR